MFLCLLLLVFFTPGAFQDSITVGDLRVSALSPTLVRVEYKGPNGFEDRTTFMVVNRKDFEPGLPISKLNETSSGTWLLTKSYKVFVKAADPLPSDVCGAYKTSTGAKSPTYSPWYPKGVKAHDRGDCCSICEKDPTCVAWEYSEVGLIHNCWPITDFESTEKKFEHEFGCVKAGCGKPIETLIVTSPDDQVLYTMPSEGASNLLFWPSPLKEKVYAITDHPRFYVPSWGPSPMPDDVDLPKPLRDTNGYDFTNNVGGDTYVFLLGETMDDWNAGRQEFLKLTGPTPLLPDFAWGTWFTWWHSYTEKEAKDDISHWKSGGLPIDVWALDMNWRETDHNKDHFYHYPNTNLFANFTEWFAFLHDNNLRTYFNDHPFPQADQTTAKEIGFRWNGLTEWMSRGLDYWWFDRNWGFSIPPPEVPPVGGWNESHTGGNYEGLDNAAWGSHVYHLIVKNYNEKHRPSSFPRPITLTKFGQPDWRPGYSPSKAQESPAHHRYPVWWTGDGVDLQASTQSMVDSGVHHLKPYVHSDCGGDYRPKEGGDLLRWTAHCTFGTIFRYHGNDHRPWTYTPHVEAVIKKYLEMRYKLMPSLIAAGAKATEDGTPLITRCDMYWPQYSEASSNDQYLFLEDTLIAPIFNSHHNMTTRSVWIPPGDWIDAWSGKVTTGPVTVQVTLPYEEIPMWHKRGGFMVTVDDRKAMTVETQDWSSLTLEMFPDVNDDVTVKRVVIERKASVSGKLNPIENPTELTLTTSKDGSLVLHIDPKIRREWTVRIHLPMGVMVKEAVLSVEKENKIVSLEIKHLQPVHSSDIFFPFGGVGTRPAASGGVVAEIKLPSVGQEVVMKVSLSS